VRATAIRFALLLAAAGAAAAADPPAPAPTPAPTPAAPLAGPLPLLGSEPAEQPPPRFGERIDVVLDSVAVRVLDRQGGALAGLTAADFRLRAGRDELPVAAVEWVGSSAPPARDLAALEAWALDDSIPPAEGKLVLFFVQASFEPSRLSGHVRMLPKARDFVGTLGPLDRTAVVSFDSHLKLRTDFTRDRERLDEALAAAFRTRDEPPPRPPRGGGPSLARQLDDRAWRAAATPERALELAAKALVPLDGPKVVVFLGWGLGNLTPIGVRLPPAYFDALRALEAARASVFVLDVSTADWHSLEVGLEAVAEHTGGTYDKTHLFPQGATDRLARAIAGYYVVYFRPTEATAAKTVRVELAPGVRGEVVPTPFGG
jgi:hypothetical protein